MALVLLIGLFIGFVSGILLSVVFIFMDVSWLRKNSHARFWERAVALLFNTCQVGFSIAGIAAVAIAFATDNEPYWLDLVIPCTLQLFAGVNVSDLLSMTSSRTHPYGSLPGHSGLLTTPTELFG